MEHQPSPPRRPKPERERAFYETPEHVKTSSRIVNEARSSLRTVKTNRPFTPKPEERTLFGSSSCRDPQSRPPSAFSLGSHHFDGSESRPTSGTRPVSGAKRLTPLGHKPKTPPSGAVSPSVPKPPVDPNRPIRRVGSRGRLLHSVSVESSSEELSLKNRSGSLQDVSTSGKEEISPDVLTRRVHSGPKERIGQLLGERGVGDGSESVHRPPSAVATTNDGIPAVGDCEPPRVKSGGSSRRPSSGGKPGSGGKREDETPEESQYFNKNVAPVLEQMASLRKEKDAAALCDLCSKLHSALKQGNMLGRGCKRRSTILKTIFKLLDSESPVLRIRLAKLILGLKITGNNLTSVCKLIFKISREESNDMLFIDEEMIAPLLETMSSTDLSSSQDALVYLLGALKFLSGNTTVGQHLTRHRAVDAYGKLLTNINTATADSKDKMGNVLVQLTAGLRNLVDNEENREDMISCHVIEEMERSTQFYSDDSEVVHNIIRIFSKVTLHSDCCSALNSIPSTYKSFLHLLNQHRQKQELIVRLTFVIGNLTAKNDEARLRFFQEENAFKAILEIFKTYLELDMKSSPKHNGKDTEEGMKNPDTVEDILIKVVRVIANLSINEEVGKQLATNEKCVQWLLHIIDTKTISTSEELVLNSVATINNLSFYHVSGSAVVKKQQQVAESFLKLLNVQHMEGFVEASRVYGNLTRHKSVRDFLTVNKVPEMMVALLDSGSREVVYTACGVLINLMADENKRHILKEEGGISKLIDVLRDFGRSDWQLGSMVCQILWNYSTRITSSTNCYGEKEAQELADLLIDFLDEETAMDSSDTVGMETAMLEFLKDVWEEEFCPVANQLLNRIESHQSDFEPLPVPS